MNKRSVMDISDIMDQHYLFWTSKGEREGFYTVCHVNTAFNSMYYAVLARTKVVLRIKCKYTEKHGRILKIRMCNQKMTDAMWSVVLRDTL